MTTWLRDRRAADPGLLRLRLALRGTLSVALTVEVLHLLGPGRTGLPGLVAFLLGGQVGMMGSFGAAGSGRRATARTVLGLPLASAAGAVPAALLSGHPGLQRAGFAALMVLAVYVRRFGAAWLPYGMLGWLSYFFTTFIRTTPETLPSVLLVVAVAGTCLLLVSVALVPDSPGRVLTAARRSWDARLAAVSRGAADALRGRTAPRRVDADLHARCFRLVEGALVLDGLLSGGGQTTAAHDRRLLLDAELAAEELAALVGEHVRARVAAGRAPSPAAVPGLWALADGRPGDALRALDGDGDGDGEVLRAATRLARLQLAMDDDDDPAHRHAYAPAVDMVQGNLPGSSPSVTTALATGRVGWGLNTRLCVQTAVAAPLALVLGSALSGDRYYWSLLACFFVLTGTFTTGEAATKGLNRVLGTLVGLVAATVAVHLTGQDTTAVVTVMLVSVFVGLYLFRVSYALMTFAVTVLLGELYNVLHEFSDGLLLLRLAETAVGAAVATAVTLLVLPVRTGRAVRVARTSFLEGVALLLDDVAARLSGDATADTLRFAARRVDARLHQLLLVSRPSSGPTLTGLRRPSALADVRRWTLTAQRCRRLAAAAAAAPGAADPTLLAALAGTRRTLAADEPAGAAGGLPAPSGLPGPLGAALDDLTTALDDALRRGAAGPVPRAGRRPRHARRA